MGHILLLLEMSVFLLIPTLEWSQVIWKQFDLVESRFCDLLGAVFCLWGMIPYNSRKTLGVLRLMRHEVSASTVWLAAPSPVSIRVKMSESNSFSFLRRVFPQTRCSPCLHQLIWPACCAGKPSVVCSLTWASSLSGSGSLTSGICWDLLQLPLSGLWPGISLNIVGVATDFILFISRFSETTALCSLMVSVLETAVSCILTASLVFLMSRYASKKIHWFLFLRVNEAILQ